MVTIRQATTEDAGRLLQIYAYYVENTAITFEYLVQHDLDGEDDRGT